MKSKDRQYTRARQGIATVLVTAALASTLGFQGSNPAAGTDRSSSRVTGATASHTRGRSTGHTALGGAAADPFVAARIDSLTSRSGQRSPVPPGARSDVGGLRVDEDLRIEVETGAVDVTPAPEPIEPLDAVRYVVTEADTMSDSPDDPAATATKVGTLAAATKVRLDGQKAGWFRIAGTDTWVDGALLSESDPTPIEPLDVTRYVTASALNVRSDSDIEAPVTGTLPFATKVSLDGQRHGWFHITGSDGWVNGAHLSQSDPRPQRPAASRPSAQSGDAAQTPAPPASSGLVAIATSQQGVPYVYGGKTPAGFDCSGFVSWVYAQAGKSVPAQTSALRATGAAISRDQARPGDVVYGPGHVGIYLGGDQMIDANRPGGSVGVRRIWMSNPVFLRF